MALQLVTAPAGYPVTLAEVMAWCRISFGNLEPAPSEITVALLSPAAAGNVDNGAHRYLATFVTADGETQAGEVSEAVTVADKTINGKVRLTAIPTGGASVTARKIYRTIAAGSTYLLLATIADNTTTVYTDNIADASLGAGAPATNTTGDATLNMMIRSATEAAEKIIRKALLTQTWDYSLDCFPTWSMWIPKPPLQSVTSISYVDTNGTTQVIDSSDYRIDTASEPARIEPAYGGAWPSARAQSNAVTVRFVCGYGAAAAVPVSIKQWIARRVASDWVSRGNVITGTIVEEMPREYIDGLLDSHAARTFAWA